jgi:hypothetical protein
MFSIFHKNSRTFTNNTRTSSFCNSLLRPKKWSKRHHHSSVISCIKCESPFAVLSTTTVSADAGFLGDNGAVVGTAIKERPRTYDITRRAWQGCAGPFTCTQLIVLWAPHKFQTIRTLGYFRFTVFTSHIFAGINFISHSTHSLTMLA